MSQITTDFSTPVNAAKAINEIETAFFDIPFENSNFQNEVFVLASQITPERAYRALGLRIHSKLRALQECYFTARKNTIRIGELQEKIESPDVTKWDKMRAEVEIDEIQSGVNYTEKLKNDAINELSCLYKHFQALPRYTREQFEAGEATHFTERLNRAVKGISGATESLVNMRMDSPALAKYEASVSNQLNLNTETLNELRKLLTNTVSVDQTA